MTYKVSADARDKMGDYFCFVPEHDRSSIIHYIEEGRTLGGFLSSFVNNDLKEAFNQADDDNFNHMGTIMRWFFNYAPSNCWGTLGAYDSWISHHADIRKKEASDA